MAVLLIIPDSGPVSSVYFDATESETHTGGSLVTSFPVEAGANVSDHIRDLPKEFRCVAWVTETPIAPDTLKQRGVVGQKPLHFQLFEPPFSVTTGALFREIGNAITSLFVDPKPQSPITLTGLLQFFVPFNARQETKADLDAILAERTTCTVLTSIGSYDAMVMTRAETTVTADGEYAAYALDFKQIITATTRSVNAPVPKEPRGNPAAKAGAKAPEAKDPDANKQGQVKTSLLELGRRALAGYLGGS